MNHFQKLTNLKNALTVVRTQKRAALAEVDRIGMEEVRLTEEILRAEQHIYQKKMVGFFHGKAFSEHDDPDFVAMDSTDMEEYE